MGGSASARPSAPAGWYTGRMARWGLRTVYAAGAVLVLILALLALTPQGRAAWNAALFVTQNVPSLPDVTWLQPEPVHLKATVPTPEGPRDADIYRPPDDGPHAAVVLFLGVAPAGPDDPRVVYVASGLARANIVTLVYWSPEKITGRIHPPDIQNLVAAFRYLQARPYVDPRRVGFAGFCVGASFALMAAAQEEVRDQVAFVNAFGPYYSLRDLVWAFGARSTSPYGEGQAPWTPDRLTVRVATTLLLESLAASDSDRVRQAVDAGVPLAATEFSSEAHAVYRLLAGGTPSEVDAALGDLPPALLATMEEASPRTYVPGLTAPVLVMHDRNDTMVPSAESRRLVADLAPRGDVRYTEFSLFEHLDPTRPLGPLDTARELGKLFGHMYAIMRQA